MAALLTVFGHRQRHKAIALTPLSIMELPRAILQHGAVLFGQIDWQKDCRTGEVTCAAVVRWYIYRGWLFFEGVLTQNTVRMELSA